MSETATPSEQYVWRRYGVKLPAAKPVPVGGLRAFVNWLSRRRHSARYRGHDLKPVDVPETWPDSTDPMDLTDTSARDILIGLACYGVLCGGLGMMIARMLWEGLSMRYPIMTEAERIKGLERLITVADLAQIMVRPKRWVRAVIVNGKLIPSVAGGNSPRFAPLVVKEWIDKGCPGLRSLRPSGRRVVAR